MICRKGQIEFDIVTYYINIITSQYLKYFTWPSLLICTLLFSLNGFNRWWVIWNGRLFLKEKKKIMLKNISSEIVKPEVWQLIFQNKQKLFTSILKYKSEQNLRSWPWITYANVVPQCRFWLPSLSKKIS